MEIANSLKKLLKEEYGMQSTADLNNAILSLNSVDISMFCNKQAKTKGAKANV